MEDQQPTEESTSNTSAEDAGENQEQEREHDCQDHLEFVDYEAVGEGWDETYVCDVCEKEFVDVYLHVFRLDGDDYSLVDEYTDEIQRELKQHQNNDSAEVEESDDK